MKRLVVFLFLSLTLAMVVSVSAQEPIFPPTAGSHSLHYGGTSNGKAARDTTYLLGGPNSFTGRFEDQFGLPSWQGWTHQDETDAGLHWHVDSFNLQPDWGNYAMWCGQHGFPGCGSGYGNSWVEYLVFTYTVPDPSVVTHTRLECKYNVDSELSWDWFDIQKTDGETAGGWATLRHTSGDMPNQRYEANLDFTPDDYVGPAANQLQFRFRCTSDDNTSDEDCLLDTNGFVQIDNIRVTIYGTVPVVFYEDHEDGDNDYWVPVAQQNVGDFAALWTHLGDMDLCNDNQTSQVAFVDDGIVVPGTGGSPCVTWCYGPGGYIVNNSGGLAGPAFHMDNLILSPVLAWPEGNDGAILDFSAFIHEELIENISPGVVMQIRVRSAVDPEDLPYATWELPGFLYYGGPAYVRSRFNVTELLEPGRTVVQIGLRCVEYGWAWGYEGTDGTPAPYFDNVAFKVFPFSAPAISARDIDLAQDNFPERGVLDLSVLANNFIRFDSALNISPQTELRNDPGDSICVNIGLTRAGSTMNGMPRLVVKMRANPLFDGVRVLPPGFQQSGDIIDGWVYGDSTFNESGSVVVDRYNFDLPDSNFLFPGDVIHYYIEAQDNLNGDIGTATLPADISDIDNFDGVMPYGGTNSDYIVRGLPTLFDAAGNQPEILFWNDYGNFGGENEWNYALNSLGYNEHVDYDVYYTTGVSSGVGNGLGGRATTAVIDGYDVLLYTSGNLSAYTLGNGDFTKDPSKDIDLLQSWFGQGDKKAFMTGDDLAYSLTTSGGAGLAFLEFYLGVNLVNPDIRPLIGAQTAPTVKPVVGNSVFTTPSEWIAYGGCPGINAFDAIETEGTTERLAQFMLPSGGPGYAYAAATRYTNIGDVILMPYDLMYVYNPAGYVPAVPGRTVRAEILRDVLIEFGKIPQGTVIDVPGNDLVFGVTNYPNPFNPVTEIKLTVPRDGHVSLKVYNVRGELVRTLVDGQLLAGVQKVPWNGENERGHQVASGVYFYETKYDGETVINKMTLVK